MKGSSENPRRRAFQIDGMRSEIETDDARTRRAIDARLEAARRWIGDDEDTAFRGID